MATTFLINRLPSKVIDNHTLFELQHKPEYSFFAPLVVHVGLTSDPTIVINLNFVLSGVSFLVIVAFTRIINA
jgi:hypothetical protein